MVGRFRGQDWFHREVQINGSWRQGNARKHPENTGNHRKSLKLTTAGVTVGATSDATSRVTSGDLSEVILALRARPRSFQRGSGKTTHFWPKASQEAGHARNTEKRWWVAGQGAPVPHPP